MTTATKKKTTDRIKTQLRCRSTKDAFRQLQQIFSAEFKKNGWTDADAALTAGVCPDTVKRFRERKTNYPRWQTVIRLFEIIGYKVYIK